MRILVKIINELEKRFSNIFSILYAIYYLHPKNAKFLSYNDLKPFAQHYKLNTEELKALENNKIVFNETYKMAIIPIKIPVSSAMC